MRQKNIEKDNKIDVAFLTEEMINFPSTIYSWLEEKATAESRYDYASSLYEQVRSETYLAIKASGEKITEANVEARIATNEKVREAELNMFKAKRDLETLKNYVESLRAKKDMIIQISADRRKEQ